MFTKDGDSIENIWYYGSRGPFLVFKDKENNCFGCDKDGIYSLKGSNYKD